MSVEIAKGVRELSDFASRYARLEQIYQIIERPLDTTVLDGEIVGIPIGAIYKGDHSDFFPILATQPDAITQVQEAKRGKRKRYYATLPESERNLEAAQKKTAQLERIKDHWQEYKREA